MIHDAELLRQYAESRSQGAFAELVRRHLNLIYFAALRRTGGNAPLAEDVAQEVFTALARQAVMLTRHVTVAGWLYTTTRFTAAKALRREQRRMLREQEAHFMSETSTESDAPADWERLRPLLDGALDELNDRDREAVLLRCLEGRTFAEIGTTLNLSEDAARMRVERALDKLHGLLAKRGVTSTASALAAALVGQAAASAPAGLAASIVGSALSGVAVAGVGSLAAVIAFMSASKITVSLAAVGALATGLAVYQSRHANSAAAELARARGDHAALAARLAELEKSATVAEKELANREAALERASLARAAELAAAARQAAADAEQAKQEKALKEFLANDPGLRSLRVEAARVNFRSSYGVFLQSIGFTPAQIDRAAEAYELDKTFPYAQLAVALEPESGDPALAKFRAWFGDAATERWAEYVRTWPESQVVSNLCSFQFYENEPFTALQVKGLIEVLSAAKTADDVRENRYTKFDWDRVLRQAEPILKPVQFEGLRALASFGKNQVLLDAAAKLSAAADPK